MSNSKISAKMGQIIRRSVKLFGCDTARISFPVKTYFLIIGHNRNTKDDHGQWTRNGEPLNFDYVAEKDIASGKTLGKLWESVKHYKRLL